MRIPRFVAAVFLAACLHASPAAVLTPEQATHVGGDLTSLGKRLAALQEESAKVIAAAPGTYGELEAALGRIHDARGKRDVTTNTWLGIVSLVLLWVAVVGFRRATAPARERSLSDPLRARGAAILFAYEVAGWAIFAVGAYAVIDFCFDSDAHQELFWVGVLWALVRWRLFMLLIDVVLRPHAPGFRLIAMSDGAARQIKAILAVVILIGLVGISVMPVLLRAGLPIPAGQVIVLLQGVVVAAGCALALWRYRLSHVAAGDWSRPRRIWFGFGIAVVLVLWWSWNVATLLLEFSVYHSLVWSLRVATFAYVVDQMLGLSSEARWVLFLQRSITAAAILAIAILLAETWLVDELALVPAATWIVVRRSLITAGSTLFFGYVAWRYLHHWTEERLRASATGMTGPDSEEEGAHPASRLTTILPMLRILAGIAILVVVVLLALSQLGVEITPLLAGAGVFGLAISFGSQALVRDVVSGIFFMADDAFRVGEYIDTGRLKGTVERISLRSVRLRHQNGQIHTIPFGQLTSITNFSRDWQTVKFNLRLSRDTDIEKVRKTVKQLGQDMLKDPELAKELLQPLKLQGVAEIADSALVVRLKFTVRPLKPTWVQREALKRIYRVFRQKGIEFASGAITVQTSGPGSAPVELATGAAAGVAAEAAAAAQRPAG
ncbi:MAG TPA: mechanosensitive ion channel domain-containing protein [Burkholderiales bacterium]|nr:mechanosensitive ion channel domain-containing protein [Burkholderiales bacterium]